MSSTFDEIRTKYRDLVLEWAAAEFDSPTKANQIFRKQHAFYKAIRDSEEGRQALTSLMGDPEPAVRCVAATHSLRFAPDTAQRVLEDLQQRNGPYAMDAKYTLISYHEGRLNLDW